MTLMIRHESHKAMPGYASVPIAFDVLDVVDVDALNHKNSEIPVRPVKTPYRKDYDAMPDNAPVSWVKRLDTQTWILLAAYRDDTRTGGAIVVTEPRAVAQLEGQPGSAVLWDLRVDPGARRTGIGRKLLAAAETVAQLAGCRTISAETQDSNAPACRLYNKDGYTLTNIQAGAYPDTPNETRLIWTKKLK